MSSPASKHPEGTKSPSPKLHASDAPKPESDEKLSYVKDRHVDEILSEIRKGLIKHQPYSISDFIIDRIVDLDEKYNPVIKKPVRRRTRRRNALAVATRKTTHTKLPPKQSHSKETLALLLRALQRNPLTFELPIEILEEVATYMAVRDYAKGETIIREGDVGDFFYVIVKGTCEVFKTVPQTDGTAAPKLVNTLLPGQAFGELALMTNSPRRASVVAAEAVTVCDLHGDHYRLVVKRATDAKIERYAGFLSTVPLMSNLTREELAVVAQSLRMQRYERGADIIRQGDVGDCFYLITKGEVEVLVDEKRVNVLGERQTFGEAALLTSEPRNATLRALSDVVECAVVDRETFISIIGPVANILERRVPTARFLGAHE